MRKWGKLTSDIWEDGRLATMAPASRDVAVVVTEGEGDDDGAPCSVVIPKDYLHVRTRPQTRQPGPLEHPELVGLRIGRLVVLGIRPDTNQRKAATWIVRCDCGSFDGRKAKAIRLAVAEKNDATRIPPMCLECGHVERLRLYGSKRSTPETRAADAARLDGLAGAPVEVGADAVRTRLEQALRVARKARSEIDNTIKNIERALRSLGVESYD